MKFTQKPGTVRMSVAPLGAQTPPPAAPVSASSATTQTKTTTAGPVVLPQSGMTMEQLLSNYQGIIKAKAIYYPVAYQFLRELGRGRQGIVFLSLRQGARGCITEHAIKVFDPSLYRTPEEYWTDMGRIASQISRLQSLQSPNLVAGHSYEETYGIGYSQMDAIDGMDLRCFLSGEHLEAAKSRSSPHEWARFMRILFRMEDERLCLQPGAVVYILRRVIRGLERLHSMNFLHCDIKPANIMIDKLGTVGIVDFGRAVIAGEKVTFLFGSPLYMAPETHRREPGRFQSDFYSVGVVALEMLRGEPLADVDTSDEKELLRIKEDLPSRLNDLLPPQVRGKRLLGRIVKRLLEPDLRKRYGSAREADVGEDGLLSVDKYLAKSGVTADHGRAFSDYISKLVDVKTRRVEVRRSANHSSVTEVFY